MTLRTKEDKQNGIVESFDVADAVVESGDVNENSLESRKCSEKSSLRGSFIKSSSGFETNDIKDLTITYFVIGNPRQYITKAPDKFIKNKLTLLRPYTIILPIESHSFSK